MIKKLEIAVAVFLLVTLVGALGRVCFYCVYHSMIAAGGDTSFWLMLLHGLKLDVAVAGYVSAVPFLLLIASVWVKKENRVLRYLWNGYSVFAGCALAMANIANIILYEYWGFPLDSTPLFYVMTSPKDAMASAEWWQLLTGFVALVIVSAAIALPMIWIYRRLNGDVATVKWRVSASLVLMLLTATLIIPIRGGFTVAVNNVGGVYFSSNTRLNHAAVNPVFSFVDSVTSDEDFSKQYRFMDDKEADKLFSQMVYTRQRQTPDSLLTQTFRTALADGMAGKGDGVKVYIVILESFSRYLMSDGGHGVKGVVPNLEKLSQEGVYFTNFYANSFRTDRGVLSILSGFPAQPTMSLMKFPHKTNNLYSIARSLKKNGFRTQYVYGGDANFTNCRSYLMSTGVADIVAEEDYDGSIPRGKWGVNDEVLFQRALEEADRDTKNGDVFRIIQTSSSHEPFDVPYKKLDDKILNAFSYADHCLGHFIDEMKKRPDWNKTLIILCPDHLGSYPTDIDNLTLCRYQIPLIICGGAVAGHRTVDTYGSQIDIAATLLALLGIDHSEFVYSKDMLDPKAPHFAFFSISDAMGLVTKDGAVVYDNTAGKTVVAEGEYKTLLGYAKAYLQKLYDDIAKR